MRAKSDGSMVTIRDVAKQSGFSSSTVSIVLNDAPLARYVPKVTKDRIQATAKKLDYAGDSPNVLGPAQKAVDGLQCTGKPVG